MSYPALERALYHVLKSGIPIEESLVSDVLKTVDWYERAMWKGVRELYDGAISTYEFESLMIDIISNQLRRAWNEGMRELGLNPEEDQTMEGEMFLQNLMAEELIHVGPLAVDIRAEVSLTNPDITQFRNRVQMWANRYNDTVNQAITFYSNNDQRLKWTYGDTDHCDTCEALDGLIAFASEWETAGVVPQSPPNPRLTCGGWKCQCSLTPTDQRRSPDALTRILDAVTAGHV